MPDITEFVLGNPALIVEIIFGVLVLWFFLVGLIKGKRKITYRWVTTIIFIGCLFVFSDQILSFVYDYDVSQFGFSFSELSSGDLVITGNTIREAVDSAVVSFVGDANTAEVSAIAIQFVGIIIKLLLFTIVGFVLAIPYRILTWLIYIIFVKPHTHKEKREDGTKVRVTKKGKVIKHKAFGGGLLNALRGAALTLFVIIILINGPLGIVPEGFSLSEAMSSTNGDQGALTVDVDEEPAATDNYEEIDQILTIIDTYKKSPLYGIGEIGSNKNDSSKKDLCLNSAINGFIWSVKVGEEKVDLRKDIKDLAACAPDVLKVVNQLSSESGEVDILGIDYTAVGNIISTVGKTQVLNTIAPVAIDVALNIPEVQTMLTENGINAESLKNIDLKSDLQAIASFGSKLNDFMSSIKFVENTENLKTLEYVDLSNIDFDTLKEMMSLVGNLSIISESMGIALPAIESNEEIKAYLDKLELDLSTIVWADTLVDLVEVAEALVDTGVKSIIYIQNNYMDYVNNLDFAMGKDYEYGTVGNVIQTLFSIKLIQDVFPNLMENVVYPMIPEQYQTLIDFTAFSDINKWENEFINLISIFKELRGTDPNTLVFNADGAINYKLINNISSDSLLKSELVITALIGVASTINNEDCIIAAAKDYIVVPDKFLNKDYAGWKQTSIYRYQCVKDIKVGSKEYKQYNTISVEEYNNLSSGEQASFAPLSKVTGGEIYYLLNSIFEVIDDIDLADILKSGVDYLDYEQLVKDLTTEDLNGKTPLDNIFDSEILKCSVSNIITKYAADYVSVPSDACDVVVVKGENVNVIKQSEYSSLFKFVNKSNLIATNYVNKDDAYNIITKEAYNLLSAEEKANYKTTLSIRLNSETLKALNVKGTDNLSAIDCLLQSKVLVASATNLCKTLAADYVVLPDSVLENEVIKVSELEKLFDGAFALLDCVDLNAILGGSGIDSLLSVETISKLLVEEEGVTPLDKVLLSDILHASLSKILIDNVGSIDMIVIPESAYTTIKVNNEDFKVVKKDEIKSILNGAIKSELLSDAYVATEDVPSMSVLKDEKITKAQYEALDEETKALFKATLDVDIMSKISTLADKDASNNMKLDYLLGNDTINGSVILRASISKLLTGIEMINVPSSLVSKDGDAVMINASELRAALVAAIKLDVLEGTEFNFDVSLINKLNEQVTGENKTKLDYVLESDILVATISSLLGSFGDTLVIPSTVVTSTSIYVSEGTKNVDVVNKTELENLINQIIELDIINESGNISADMSLINKLDGVSIDSVILRATISKILLDNETLIVPAEAKETLGSTVVIKKAELEAFISSVVDLGLVNESGELGNLDNLAQSLINNEHGEVEAVNNSLILRATLADKVNASIAIPDDAKDTTSSTLMLSKNELANLFGALKELGITSFDNVEIKPGKLFKLIDDNKINNVFNSILVWNMASNSIKDSGMFDNSILVKATKVSFGANNTPATSSQSTTDVYAFEQSLTDLRLTKQEIISILTLVKQFNTTDGVVDYEATSLDISSDAMSNVFTDAATYSPLLTNSILMTYKLANILSDAIDEALTGDMATYAQGMKDRIALISNNDKSLWSKEASSSYNSGSLKQVKGNELFKLLSGLDTLKNTSIEDVDLSVLNNSYVLRVILNDTSKFSMYKVTTQFSLMIPSRNYTVNQCVVKAEYDAIIEIDSAYASNFTSFNFNDQDTEANRSSWINAFNNAVEQAKSFDE